MTTATAPAPGLTFDRTGFDALLAAHPAPDWVTGRRRAALEALAALGLPDRRSENWMRTDLRMFKPQAWALRAAPAAAAAMPEGLLAAAIAAGETAADFSFDDAPRPAAATPLAGRFASLDGHVLRDEVAPALAARGVVFGAADRVLADHAAALAPHWFSVIDAQSDWFAALHAAFHRASAVLYVPAGVRVTEPLHVLSAISAGGVDTSHVLVVLGDGAEATLLTETAGGGPAGSAGGFHCGGTEIVVGRGAFLRMVNLQNWNTGVWHFARQKAVVHENGRLQWTLGALGSRVSQVAQDVALAGRGADAQVNGVMFTEGRQHLVYNTLQHHEAPGCKSDLLYKGALQDRSRLVWRGMIKVDKAAQKTDGYQRNDNLMLSTEARADSIPGLEIEADDVRCTHGATSGRVDAEQVFYAQARGLTADEAARLVVAGFFQQVFDRITIPPVREALARAVTSRIRRIA
ncbi:MAG: Fe-S cluster assembly protein SufD [Planctomycetaceae bacterium]|jgi:Fe-S cluster assembly protein SufD|nr:Fe-S cluster assembly protein SufD [Planctomycetaceae bacterium]